MLQPKAIKPYLKPKKVLGYMFMPRVIPRIKDLFGQGFSWIAMLMALIYQSVRLLPTGHPYTNPENKGRFGIRNVIMEAAFHLDFKKENIDQIIVFLVILIGFLLLVFQIAMVLMHLLIAPAFASFAGIPGFVGLFATPNPTNDIAFMLLDQVFGIPNLYNSKFAPGAGSIPPFQQGLQTLFQYYSMMILIVAVFVFLYYVVVTLGETVTTGVPFGRRFNTIYAPLRLVIAIGLIVPINYGLNCAQYITLFSAKYGSSLATNGWILFANNVANPTDLQDEALLARPTVPNINHIVKFMMIVQACRFGYEALYQGNSSQAPDIANSGGLSNGIQPYYVTNFSAQQIPLPAQWQDAIDFFGGEDITIRFGHHDPSEYYLEKGNVRPYCGEINVHVTSHDGDNGVTTGAEEVQQQYLRMITYLWQSPGMQDFGRRAQRTFIKIGANPPDPCAIGFPEESGCFEDSARFPPEEYKQTWYTNAQNLFYTQVAAAYANATNGTYAPAYAVPQDLLDRGWGGAAIWYNHIAEWNGAFTSAALNVPTPSKMPSVMEKVEETRRTNDEIVDPGNRFRPHLSDDQTVDYTLEGELAIAEMLNETFKYWEQGDDGQMTDTQANSNVIISVLTAIFGLNGLFDMRDNPDTHPLAALVAAGKAIIDSAIRNLMVGLIGSTAGGAMGALEPHMGGGFLTAASSMFVSFATIGITVGFILYYILPFIPFMYFFFAVGSWVKSIFEALVGVPLWALAHLRVDGNGIPGDSASAGYFLIFEIFIRPILTVFGLLGGMAIFSAMMRVLHDIFPLVTANLTGFDASVDPVVTTSVGIEYKRDIIDEFMFTIVYTIIAYMIATSSFKMIDQVPNSILRWMGAGVQSFSDNNESAVQGLVQYAGIGGYGMATQVTGAMASGAEGAGAAVGTAGRGIWHRLGGGSGLMGTKT